MTAPTSPRRFPLSPARALLHPLWLSSLAVLALNDHVLKGSGLLPGVVTGKLSDVVGLIVAPVLLAALLGMRSRRALVAAHILVGLVFSAIQLSASAAAGWSAFMGLFGFPWLITMDPTDLAALPALAISWRVLVPAMTTRARHHLRASAQVTAAGAGLLCCMGTSGPEPEPGEPTPEVFGSMWVHNFTANDQAVQIRQLGAEVLLDCQEVSDDPGGLLTDDLFGDSVTWNLEPDAAVALDEGTFSEAGCHAALVSVSGETPELYFWLTSDLRQQLHWDDEVRTDPGAIALREEADGTRNLTPNRPDLRHPRDTVTLPPAQGVCAAQSDLERVAFAGPGNATTREILAVEVSADGCIALELSSSVGPSSRAYICVPEAAFPFTVGDHVRINAGDALHVEGRTAQDEPLSPTVSFTAGTLSVLALPSDLDVLAADVIECDAAVYDVCGSVARPATLALLRPDLGGAKNARAGQAVLLPGADGSVVDITVVHALTRLALEPNCAAGPDTLGHDVELAITYRGPTAP